MVLGGPVGNLRSVRGDMWVAVAGNLRLLRGDVWVAAAGNLRLVRGDVWVAAAGNLRLVRGDVWVGAVGNLRPVGGVVLGGPVGNLRPVRGDVWVGAAGNLRPVRGDVEVAAAGNLRSVRGDVCTGGAVAVAVAEAFGTCRRAAGGGARGGAGMRPVRGDERGVLCRAEGGVAEGERPARYRLAGCEGGSGEQHDQSPTPSANRPWAWAALPAPPCCCAPDPRIKCGQ